VPELAKREGLTCKFCTDRCVIYERRPESCAQFECEWLKGEMPDYMRPDRSKLVVERVPGRPIVIAIAAPGCNANALKEYTEELRPYVEEGLTVVAKQGWALMADGATADSVLNHVLQAKIEAGVA
jgi:hypothetical protein